jgi:hypothetical protein
MHLTSFVKDKTAQERAQLVYGRKEAHLSQVYEIFFLTNLQRYPVNPNWNLANGQIFGSWRRKIKTHGTHEKNVCVGKKLTKIMRI